MVSTRGRYAIRVMIDLAEHEYGKYIPLRGIAERQDISKKYLEIIMRDLVSGGLVEGSSGKGGGYRLCRPPEDYTVAEILDVIREIISPVACLAGETNECPRKMKCQTLPMWEEFDALAHDFFSKKRLSDLAGATSPGEGSGPRAGEDE